MKHKLLISRFAHNIDITVTYIIIGLIKNYTLNTPFQNLQQKKNPRDFVCKNPGSGCTVHYEEGKNQGLFHSFAPTYTHTKYNGEIVTIINLSL